MELIFNYEDSIEELTAKENEKIDDVFDRYTNLVGLHPQDTKFYYNSQEIRRRGKTLL